MSDTVDKKGLTTPQIRVLQVLYQTRGVLTKAKIADRIGAKAPVSTAWAIGYSDPKKREAFKLTKDAKSTGTPLLELGYVEERVLDVDGLRETGYQITELGVLEFEKLGKVRLPPPRDSYAKKKGRESIESEKEDTESIGVLDEFELYSFEQVSE